jgi:hypothetical protein
MLTEDKIQSCMDEVSDEALQELLRDEECFHTGLVKAIVNYAAFGGKQESVHIMILGCAALVHEHQYKLAEKIAQEKDDASRFQADMKDKFQ